MQHYPEQIQLVAEHTPKAAILNLIAIILMAAVLWTPTPALWLLLMIGVNAISMFIRLWLARNASTDTERDLRIWIRYYNVSMVISGLSWGSGALMAAIYGDITHQLFAMVLILGILTAATATMAVIAEVFNSLMFSSMGLTLVSYLISMDKLQLIIALLILMFMVIAYEAANRQSQRMRELVETKRNMERQSQALTEAKTIAEHANRAKSEFLTNMSHELRTPLNAVLGFAQILEMEKLEDMQQQSVQEILKGGQHLLALINEILDLSKIEAGQMHIHLRPIDIGPVLRQCERLLRPLAEKHQVELKLIPSKSDGTLIISDEVRLKQALLNLITNGIKYNRPHGEVRVYCEHTQPNKLRIHIADTGVGIHEDDIKELFQPFHRLESGDTHIEGTGIGLALTKRLVTLMNGDVDVRSEAGQGSVFWLELPLAKA